MPGSSKRCVAPGTISIFTSPRDQQKYVVRYNLKLEPGGPTRAVAWEATGHNGKRFVAYSTGEVEEVDEAKYQKVRFVRR